MLVKTARVERVGQGWQIEFHEDEEVLAIKTWGQEEEAKRRVMEFLFPAPRPETFPRPRYLPRGKEE